MKVVSNQRGNIALFTLGLLSVFFILFVFIFNLAKVYAVKEMAHTSSQQASLAATAVFYQGIMKAVDEYDSLPPILDEILDPAAPLPFTLEWKIKQRKESLANQAGFQNKSVNERHIEAIDQVLSEELSGIIVDVRLKNTIVNKFNSQIKYEMIDAARDVILANGGTLKDAEMTLFRNNRVYISSGHDLQATTIGKYFEGVKEQISQLSAGGKIAFLPSLNGLSNEEISLQ